MPAARLAQSVERKALNLVVVGSSPTAGVYQVPCHVYSMIDLQCTIIGSSKGHTALGRTAPLDTSLAAPESAVDALT